MTSKVYYFEPLNFENFNKSLEFFKSKSKVASLNSMLKAKRSKSLVSIPNTRELFTHRLKQHNQQRQIISNRLSQLVLLEEEDNNESDACLSDEDFEFIERNTGFTHEQIQTWYSEFMCKSPRGLISLKQFSSFYESLMPSSLNEKSKLGMAKKLFKVFDIDADGYLNFAEFLVSFWVRCQAPLHEKFNWIFNMLDTDHNGTLEYNELKAALISCLNLNDLDELLEQLNDEKISYMQQAKANIVSLASSDQVINNDDYYDDEAFFEDPSSTASLASTSKSSLKLSSSSNNNNLNNDTCICIKHQQQYTIYTRTTKLLDDKVHELILLLNASTCYFHNKSQTPTQLLVNQYQHVKKIKLTRLNFVDLCVRYRLLRKLLVPIRNYYDFESNN